MTDTRDKIVNIDAAGDIILVVGPEKLRLRVRSLFLKAASKLSGTILGPDWKEGHDILGTGLPVEIVLPEENATALRCICAILHHQIKLLPQIMAVNDVLRVAVTANKFGVVDALTFASQFWLYPLNRGANDLIALAAAASLFKNAQAFRDITKALVLNYGDSYLALLSEDIMPILGERVFCLLEEQRGFARLKLGEILIKGINALACVHRCGWTSKYAFAYMKLLEAQDLWPTSLFVVAEAIERANMMPDPIPEESSAQCRYGYKHFVPEYRKSFRYGLDDLTSRIGICLHCFHSNQAGPAFCQTAHEHQNLPDQY
ncbi:unnamed protein product [Penicillium salamii]|nr:unnamed protein product [Penicillium salamii]CAG8015548.1 unnamed protein product [Penicillium salamii]CAG8108471.1 unnamed protein product [Penicillium salamii]CAG8218957.1 unnamed protein product [Penicillium salamii]CAG8268685.1 unnamed protein product [Penicillium salamii]